jgi:hypothetical protein
LHWQRSFDHQKCHDCKQPVDCCCLGGQFSFSAFNACYVSDIHVFIPFRGKVLMKMDGQSFELDLSLLMFMSCYGLDEIWQSFIELCVLNSVNNSVSRDCQIYSSGLSKMVVSMARICHHRFSRWLLLSFLASWRPQMTFFRCNRRPKWNQQPARQCNIHWNPAMMQM